MPRRRVTSAMWCCMCGRIGTSRRTSAPWWRRRRGWSMPDLTAAHVTITVQAIQIHDNIRRNLCSLSFGDGALTYPTGGVPLPTATAWGMTAELRYLILLDPNDASGILWKYDLMNHKLRAYIQGVTV